MTIRGAFPTFETSQVDATILGTDLQLDWLVHSRVRLRLDAQLIKGMDLTNDQGLVRIPAAQTNQSVSLLLLEGRVIKSLHLNISAREVFKQRNLRDDQDYVPIPDGYWLLGSSLTSTVKWGDTEAKIGLYVDNVLNTRFRDYMNRFRYYADGLGRNFTLRFSVPMQDLITTKTEER